MAKANSVDSHITPYLSMGLVKSYFLQALALIKINCRDW